MHAVLAAAVWGHAAALVWRVARQRREAPELVPSARAMALAVTLQVVLGVAAWWLLRPFDGMARYGDDPAGPGPHRRTRPTGRCLLGSAVVLTLRSFRRLAPTPRAATAGRAVPLTWEAVA